ncbi:MAG: aldehyde dehydrogenase [Sphaerochaetaceae bacterium]
MTTSSIVSLQREFFATGKTLDVDFRLDALKKLQKGIQDHEQRILDALHSDLNKTGFEGYMTEIGMVLDELRFAIKHLRSWARFRRIRTPIAQFHAKSFIVPEPYGVTLIMSPWNYPFQLCIEPLIGALCGGNTAVVKPSAYSTATSQAITDLLGALFPAGHVAVVQGGREQNMELLEQKFDYIFFTGSVDVGKLVMEKASRHLTPVSLELGGKSPVIVDRTANLRLAARRIAFGKFLNAGQTCVAPDYLLIDESVKERFVQLFAEELGRFFPNGDFSELPVIVNDKHFKRLLGLIEGEKVLIGGNSEAARRFIAPTVLDGITFDSPIMQQEIFGPILPVITFKDMDEVISRVGERPKPLALYLFTTDKRTEQRILGKLSFGGGCVNDTIIHLATSRMGFGGVGDSGMGSYHGKPSFDTFTHYKSVVDKSNWIDLPMRYHPYTASNARLLKMFLK